MLFGAKSTPQSSVTTERQTLGSRNFLMEKSVDISGKEWNFRRTCLYVATKITRAARLLRVVRNRDFWRSFVFLAKAIETVMQCGRSGWSSSAGRAAVL